VIQSSAAPGDSAVRSILNRPIVNPQSLVDDPIADRQCRRQLSPSGVRVFGFDKLVKRFTLYRRRAGLQSPTRRASDRASRVCPALARRGWARPKTSSEHDPGAHGDCQFL
jgi:hypothetical protein